MKLIILSILFGITLFSFPFGYPISIGDGALIAWVSIALVYSGKISTSPISTSSLIWYFLASISGLFISASVVTHTLDFSSSDFFVSIARATLGVSIVLTTKPLIKKVGTKWFLKSLISIIKLHSVLVIAGAVIYKIFEVNIGLRIIKTATGSVRSSGLFAEPAWFGWFVGTSLFAVSSYQKKCSKIFLKWYDIIIFITAGIWASKSLTAIVCISGGLFACLFSHRRMWKFLFAFILLCSILVSFVYFSISPKISTGSSDDLNYIERRVVGIVTGKDLSSVTRYYGSLVRTQYILEESPFIGAGVGNNVKAVKGDLFSEIRVVRQGDNFHMLPFTALAATGLLGGVAYIAILLLTLRRKSEWLGMGILLLSFSFGGYLLGVIWWFIGLADTFQSQRL